MLSTRSTKSYMEFILFLVYVSGATVGLVCSLPVSGDLKNEPINSLAAGHAVMDRSKRSLSAQPRLAKLLETYVNLARSNLPNTGNEYNRNDSPADFALGGIDAIGGDDISEGQLKRSWDLKSEATKDTDTLIAGLNSRLSGEQDGLSSSFLNKDLRRKLRSKMADLIDDIYRLRNEDAVSDAGDATLFPLLAKDDTNLDDSPSMNKRQQGWHFQYGKRSIPEYRSL